MEIANIPSELNLSELKKQVPPAFDGYKDDKVHCVCHFIYNGMLLLDEDTNCHPEKDQKWFVPLHNAILKHYLTTASYKAVLDWMAAAGIIESDKQYAVGSVTIGYRFTEKYRLMEVKTIAISDDVIWRRAPYAWESHGTSMNKILKKQTRWYKDLSIDSARCRRIVEDIYNRNYNDALNTRYKRSEKLENAMIKRNSYMIHLDKWDRGDFFHYQDSTGYRLHTLITSLPKSFRAEVRYKGMPLAEVDLSNSQLFFALFLMVKKNWNKTNNTKLWENLKLPPKNTIMSSKVFKTESGGSFGDDVFMEKVRSGTIYDHFIDRMDAIDGFFKENWGYKEKRDKVKDLLLKMIYANPGTPMIDFLNPVIINSSKTHKPLYQGIQGELWKAFLEDFPCVAEIFTHIKRFDYKTLSKILTRIESEAVLNHSCKYAQEYDIPFFTLHDCGISTEDNIDVLEQIMQLGALDVVGVSAATKIKYWSEYKYELQEDEDDDYIEPRIAA